MLSPWYNVKGLSGVLAQSDTSSIGMGKQAHFLTSNIFFKTLLQSLISYLYIKSLIRYLFLPALREERPRSLRSACWGESLAPPRASDGGYAIFHRKCE